MNPPINLKKRIATGISVSVKSASSPTGIFNIFIIKRLKKVCHLYIIITILSLIGSSCSEKNTSPIKVSDLKCEYQANPLGIDNEAPRFSWLLFSPERNQKQSAYRILVASSQEKLNNDIGDIWDSHKVKSDRSVQVAYEGIKLESGNRYYWKVRIWDKNRNKSEWSKPAYWEMGLLNAEDWKAEWITFKSESAPYFRKEFDLSGTIREARVYISGLGYYELCINGLKIGDHVLDPGQTDYEQRTFYVSYDVTGKLKQGSNTIGVILGDGWYNQKAVNHGRYGWSNVVYGQPCLIFQMNITFNDGTLRKIISDETWKASGGPIISNNIYTGEEYDARLEQDGWDNSGFNDSGWERVKKAGGPGGKLVSQDLPPIKKVMNIKPVRILNPKPRIYIYDMGQNFAGWCKLKIRASEGTKIQLRFAEWLGKDGMIDPGSTGVYATGVIQTDKYTCKGNDLEIWEPKFTYHGFQYVEMTGYPGKPSLDNLEGIVVHSALEKSGTFECSDSMINKLHRTALWTEISNLHSIPTDCPHRERCGWLGDAFLTSDMVIYNFDAARFWTKFTHDIETSRRGDLPSDISPGRRVAGRNPDWGAAFVQLPWQLYLYYADTVLFNDHYEGIKYYMNNLQKIAINNIIPKGIGSLFSPGRIKPFDTPREFTSTVMYYFCVNAMTGLTRATGRKDDESLYSSLADSIKSEFNKKFYDKSGKTYGNQEKNALALAFGLVPDKDDLAVAENLNRDVMETNKGHVTTGVFGTRYIYEVLGKYGYEETIENLFHSNDFPSYGYLFSRGATTFWENWGELKFADREAPGDDRSKSHPFRGGFDAWFYYGIAGINPDPEKPGFKHIILKPMLTNSLNSASAEYNSIHGLVKSIWRKSPEGFKWVVSVPVNTSATIYIPADNEESVFEGETIAVKADGVKYKGTENGISIYEIGSGDYSFFVKRNK